MQTTTTGTGTAAGGVATDETDRLIASNKVEGTAVTLAVETLDVAPDLARLLVGAGYQLYGMVPVQRSLEDIFVDLVGEVQEG